MQDERKTKKQLVRELRTLRAKLKRLEKSDDDAIGGVQIISQDITERKKADVEIALLAHTTQSIGECVSITDTENKILFVNDAFLKTYGYTRDELLGKPISIVRSTTTEPAADEVLHTTLQGRWQGELVNRRKDGTEFPIALSTSVVRNEKGQPIALVGIAVDITERKRAEEALKKSTQLLMDTGEMAKVGGWELDLSTKEVSMTEEVCRIHGVEPGYKLKLEEAMSFYAPESKPALEEVLKKATESGEPYDLESLFIPSGSKDKIWVRSLGRAVYSGGRIVKLAGTFQNIDKYKRTEEALKESEIKYRNIFENVIEGIFQVTPEGRFRIVNPALARMYRYSSPEEMIETITDIGRQLYVNPDERFEFLRILHEKGSVTGFGVQLKRKDGSTFWASVNVRCVYDENGNILYHEGTSEDITERKRAEEATRQSEALLNATQRLTKVGGWEWTIASQTMFWTDEVYHIHGFYPGEIPSGSTEHIDRSLTCYDPQDRPAILEIRLKSHNWFGMDIVS